MKQPLDRAGHRRAAARFARSSAHRRVLAGALLLGAGLLPAPARADDLAGVVARAREQVERGDYADALNTLDRLPTEGLPKALAVEASLLAVTSALVARGAEAAEAACAEAVVASDYDPEVARDQSPKVRQVCLHAAVKERANRLQRERIELDGLRIDAPTVAWQPVRISATASGSRPWLRVVARISSPALDGSFDVALVPSVEGPLRGTLDPSWIRPRAKIRVELIAQDRFGDLGPTGQLAHVEVPAAEAILALGEVPAGATVKIDGVVVAPGPLGRAPVAPGPHKVTMELKDGATASAGVDVTRGSEARVALSPQKAASTRAFGWIATGASLSLCATGAVLLLSADSRRAEIEELAARREEKSNLPAVEYSEIESKDEDRKTFATFGTASLIAGAVVGAAAITFWVWPAGEKKKEASSLGARLVLGGASVTGAF
jgi:hypothetical protein